MPPARSTYIIVFFVDRKVRQGTKKKSRSKPIKLTQLTYPPKLSTFPARLVANWKGEKDMASGERRENRKEMRK